MVFGLELLSRFWGNHRERSNCLKTEILATIGICILLMKQRMLIKHVSCFKIFAFYWRCLISVSTYGLTVMISQLYLPIKGG